MAPQRVPDVADHRVAHLFLRAVIRQPVPQPVFDRRLAIFHRGYFGLGMARHAVGMAQLTGYSATVFLTNLFLMPKQLDEFLALPKEVFDGLHISPTRSGMRMVSK